MLLARLAGGPYDGESLGVEDTLTHLELPFVDDPHSERFVYHRINGWTEDGLRYFVAPDYRKSLIGDAEIKAAAQWLASTSKDDPDSLDRWQADFRKRRDEYVGEPDGTLKATTGLPPADRLIVYIRPGQVFGYVNEETSPSFVWPPIAWRDEAQNVHTGRSD
jgi:hypothetical protein